ncbi:MAG: sodium:solute symporter, partial [Flavobacteriaceae bacterium]|nr:sodium:solute symporter [Flavobacteriaceae bacterium]
VMNSEYADEYRILEKEHDRTYNDKQVLINEFLKNGEEKYKQYVVIANDIDKENREAAKELIAKANSEVETNDKDYVFIHFILNYLPKGLIGLLLAVILSAAMSSTASELNALASTTTIDLYKRNLRREETEEHFVKATRWFTFGWGILAIIVASVANLFDNLIQLVNIIGSLFYGNVLGIFLLAFFFKYVKGNAVFIAALITQIVIFGLYALNEYDIINLPYLWLNFVGCILVIMIAFFIQSLNSKSVE